MFFPKFIHSWFCVFDAPLLLRAEDMYWDPNGYIDPGLYARKEKGHHNVGIWGQSYVVLPHGQWPT